ncbi:MAG: polysaccharide biosynthesis/export family protein [Terracidiphilus sp.]
MHKTTIGIVFLLLVVPVLGAQSSESLRIGPGDLVHIIVFDTPELEQHLRVTDAGELPLLVGGSVKVAGLSSVAAARAVEDALTKRNILINPRVQVIVDDFATQKVSVFGEVRAPGAYTLSTSRSILDVLSLAGGLTDVANRQIVIKRSRSDEKVSYLVSNDPNTAFDTAVTVNPGDTILVPKAHIVYMLGDVRAPGGYTMTNNAAQLSALQLLARAGGTLPTAVPSHARLIRKTGSGFSETPLPLSAMEKGKSADIALQPDDIIYVPFSYLRNFAVEASGIVATAANAAVYRF